MSGTSLDGMDMALIELKAENGNFIYKVLYATTLPYPEEWILKLKQAPGLSGLELIILHQKYGEYIGEQALGVIQKTGIKPDLIASHGHTVFHRPRAGITLQIGNGAYIAAKTNTTTVSDFRTLDVALGGQGAPLVPIGDKLLFGQFEKCLNLGGFSNISFEINEKRLAFDICPVNIALNHFSGFLGLAFDPEGQNARNGKINPELLSELNKLEYYRQSPPKSLGREWLEQVFLPVTQKHLPDTKDILRTICEHIADQIVPFGNAENTILTTGGGAHNTFLMELLNKRSHNAFYIPNKETVDFKEAIVFAFLGILRTKNLVNCLSSVTGSLKDNCGGIVHFIK